MAIKNDMVMSYIESLDVGTKVSVRGLSAQLGVSEGTVYKAIKSAEACGLVMTRPKAGTFRIDSAVSISANDVTITQLSKILGLTLSAGAHNGEKTVKRIVICDGDEESVLAGIRDKEEADDVICIVGNRPEIQSAAIQNGAHLLITGGGRPCENLMIAAEKKGVCILASLQSTYALLRLLDSHLHGGSFQGAAGMAKDWMQLPYHLYYNDIAADWHRFFVSIPSIVSEYPVVDDALGICGTLDIAKAFAANPSQKISGILTETMDCLQVTSDVPMQDIAEKMVLTGKNLAAVTREGKMCGLITANDLLRYFLYAGRSGAHYKYESFLEELGGEAGEDQKIFVVHCPDEAMEASSEFAIMIMLAAAQRHAARIWGQTCVLANGTFFATSANVAKDHLMLSSVVSRSGEKYCAFEVELHDDTQSYTKAVLMFSHA